jgi:hypothetical protein
MINSKRLTGIPPPPLPSHRLGGDLSHFSPVPLARKRWYDPLIPLCHISPLELLLTITSTEEGGFLIRLC